MFSGSIVAIVTPFANDRVDLAALKRHIDWLIEQGTQGILPCGTTGESATFTHDEQKTVVAEVVQHVRGRVPVIAGAGSNCTREAVDLAQAAERLGANGVLSIVPYYNKPPQDGIYRHFKAVREAMGLPMILYNVPGRTGINMLAETAARVNELGGIGGVKESTGNMEQAQELIERGVTLLSGDDHYTFPFMMLGAVGVVSVVANFAPRTMRSLVDACAAGDLGEARRLHRLVCELQKVAFCETNPIPTKAAVAALGFCREEFRLPLVTITPANRERLLSVLRRCKILA